MTPIKPKTIANPNDMISRMELRLIPRKSVSIAFDQTPQVSIRSIAAPAAFATVFCGSVASAPVAGLRPVLQGRHAVLTAEFAELIGCSGFDRRIVRRKLEQRRRLFHRIAHPTVRLVGRGGIQPRNRRGLAGCAEIRRRRPAHVGVGAGQIRSILEEAMSGLMACRMLRSALARISSSRGTRLTSPCSINTRIAARGRIRLRWSPG